MQQTINRAKMLFVGVDVHKDTHTAVGLSPFGEKVFSLTIGNGVKDFGTLLEKTNHEAMRLGLSAQFGLEDVHSWGERLSSYLVTAGVSVRSVAPILVDHHRQKTTHPEKNDSLDAQGVAEVMIQKIDTLPMYTITEEAQKAKDIREISLEREWLVKERARLKNQLHILLHRIHNTEYKNKFKDPFSLKAMKYWMKSATNKGADTLLTRRMKRAIRRLRDIRSEILELEKELAILIKVSGHTIETANGCGTVIAAEIIGEVGDIARFKTPGALAKYSGCAPREHSSGKTKRYRKTRSGNRRLNRAFHRMALSQISRMGNDAARNYFKRKISEGKTKAQALVCLRRQLVNVVWTMMKQKTEYIYPHKND